MPSRDIIDEVLANKEKGDTRDVVDIVMRNKFGELDKPVVEPEPKAPKPLTKLNIVPGVMAGYWALPFPSGPIYTEEDPGRDREWPAAYLPSKRPETFISSAESQRRVPSISAGKPYEPGIFERAFKTVSSWFGKDYDPSQISDTAKAEATVRVMAKDSGLPLNEYRKSPEAIEQFTKGLVNSFSAGLAPAIGEATGAGEGFEATTPTGKIAHAGGSLVGMIAGLPFGLAKGIIGIKPLAKLLPRATADMPIAARLLRESLHDAILLGTASGIESIGEASKNVTFTQASKDILNKSISGALVGTVFGAARGMFPNETVASTGARLMSGLLGLNALRATETGGNPFTDRSVGEVAYDVMLDAFFLWRGLPEAKFVSIADKVDKAKNDAIAAGKKIVEASTIEEEALRIAQLKIAESDKAEADRLAQEAAKEAASALEVKEDIKKTNAKISQAKMEELVWPPETEAGVRAAETAIGKAVPKKTELIERARKVLGEEVTVTGVDTKQVPEIPTIEKSPAPIPEPITDLDLQTGTPEPEGLSAEESPFRQDRETTIGRSKALSDNTFVAETVDELLNQNPIVPTKAADVTTWKLTNDVNRWMDGEEVDIDRVRELLSEISADADQFRGQFQGPDYPKSFNAWRENVREAAKWARKADRTNFVQTQEAKGEFIDVPAVEKFFGKDLEDITDAELEKYAKEHPVEAKDVTESGIEEVAQGELTEVERQAEIAKLLGEQEADVEDTKMKQRRKRRDTSLYSGLDPFEVAKEVSTWYSKLRKAAEDKLPRVAPAEQIANTLRKIVGKDEWDKSRLSELLVPGTKVSKEEVLRKIDENLPKFKDVILEPRKLTPLTPEEEEEIATLQRPEFEDSRGPRFTQYQEPGGSNYKELFVTAPAKDVTYTKEQLTKEMFISNRSWLDQETIDNLWNEYQRGEREPIELSTIKEGKIWQDGHLDYADIENPIVRLRFNTRFAPDPTGSKMQLADGKTVVDYRDTKPEQFSLRHGGGIRGNKILFLEEMQPPSKSEQAKMPPEYVKRWREIGMKRAIKYAVDGGYDRVAWTTGEMQVERYPGLDQHTNELQYGKNPDGTYWLSSPGNMEGIDVPSITSEKLSDYVGPEIANKIKNKIGDRYDPYPNAHAQDIIAGRQILPIEHEAYVLKDIDLKIENKGLRKVYDVDLPNVAKSLGGKVEDTTISLPWPGQVTTKHIATVPSISLSPFKPRWTPSLYSGIDPTQIGKVVGDLARGFAEHARKSDEAKAFDTKQAIKRFRKEFVKSGIERSGNARREFIQQLSDRGYEIVQSMYLIRGGHPKATRMFEQARAEYDEGLSANEKKIRNNLIRSKRIIDITGYKTSKQYQPPEKMSRNASLAYSQMFPFKKYNLLEDLTPEAAARVGRATEIYFEWEKKVIRDAEAEGLLTKEMADGLIAHNYQRTRKVEDIFDKKNQVVLGGRKISVRDSGVQVLARGTKTDMYEMDADILLLETFNRLYGRGFKNRANKELATLARENKENPFARMKESKEDRIPSEFRNNRTYVYEDGVRKTIFLGPDIAEEWLASNAQTTAKYGQFLRWASGAPIVKTFATGINWAFALRNLPRDVSMAWFTARTYKDGKYESVYSPHIPVAALQMAQDYKDVFLDALLKKGRYDDYIDDGGGMELLTAQGRMLVGGKHLERDVEKFFNFMGAAGTFSETWTRLALRDRVIKNEAKKLDTPYEETSKDSKIRRKATFAARDYMDFSQGGEIVKALDNALPYFNARILATRGILRTMFKDQPVVSAYKLGQFALLATGLYIANKERSPRTMEELKGDRRAQGNFVFPLGDNFGFEDEEGNTRYPFIVLPLDAHQKFFKAVFEASADHWMGNPVDPVAVARTLKDFMPIDVTSLPPTWSGALGYLTDTNFWAGQRITKEGEGPFRYPESKREFIEGETPQALIDIGQVTGLSPDRLKYALGELFTNDNMFGQVIGKGYDATIGQLPKPEREQAWAEILASTPVIKSLFKVTNPYSKFAEDIGDAKEKAAIETWVQNSGTTSRIDAYLYKKTMKREEVVEFIYQFPDKDDRNRLMDSLKGEEKMAQFSNQKFWRSLRSLGSVPRAEAYNKAVGKAGPEVRQQLEDQLDIIKRYGGLGIATTKFNKALRNLQ